MTDFGDFDPDDAFDNEPADPEQVAIKLHRLRLLHEVKTDHRTWDELTPAEKLVAIDIIARLIAWLRRQGSLQ